MLVWKNTSTLEGYDSGINFTEDKNLAEIALLGSKSINIHQFPKLKGIFRAGIGKDNVPEEEAKEKNILVKYPSKDTIDIIYNETAAYTCSLIFRMLYTHLGTLEPWLKYSRPELKSKTLLIVGKGNIGNRVFQNMKPFMNVISFDILENQESELQELLTKADCISLHIPKMNRNDSFINKQKLSIMKDNAIIINTARGFLVDEEALYVEISKGRLIAAFDVFWEEPYKGKLSELSPDKFFMSPHIASTCIGFLKGCRKGLDKLIRELNND
jgi:phosphoglycerate dehydrogenase-like enzyme